MKNRVKEERAAQKKAQGEMAQFCGVSRQSLHAIESQKLKPTVFLALKIARFLNCKVEDLFIMEEL